MNFAALFILAIAAATFGPLLLWGLPGSFASSGQDVGTAMLWLHGFSQAVGQGIWWPRWLIEGNRGFGSPVFLFYPPGAYWAAAAMQRATGLDTAGTLIGAALLWRFGAAVFAYVWLRTRATPPAALAATALFSLQTYNMLVNPLVRFAYAEIAGTCLMLVALLAAGSRRILLWVPPAFAALAMTHLPMAVLAGGVLPAWSLIATGASRDGVSRAVKTLLACLLGAGIAGAYLVPALTLLPEIYMEGWDTGGLTVWSGHFLLDAIGPSKAPVQFWFMNAGLVLVLASSLILGWYGRREAPPMRDRLFAGAAAGLGVLCLLMTRLSWPVWSLLPILHHVQFPWRLMPYVTAAWAMLMARRLDVLAAAGLRGGGRIAAGFAILLGAAALWLPYSTITASMPALARYNWTRLQPPPAGPRALPAVNPPEYAPRSAARAGWRADDPATDAILLDALARSRAAAPNLRTDADPAGILRVEGELAAPAELLLAQFAFPGWAMVGAPAGAALAVDPPTGLLRLAFTAGHVDLAVARTATDAEQVGWAVSGGALLLWLSCLVLARWSARSIAARRTGWARAPAGP